MKKYTKEYFAEQGKKGGKQKGINSKKKRHEIIFELSGLVEKSYLNYLQSWPTAHLERLLEAYRGK